MKMRFLLRKSEMIGKTISCQMLALLIVLVVPVSVFSGCASESRPASVAVSPPKRQPLAIFQHPSETRFSKLYQLTFSGENAEAYWSPNGKQLIYQAHEGEGCDQIYRLQLRPELSDPELVSTGQGVTTCAFFFPDNESILYSSTHGTSPECPARPDHSQGYVWPVREGYEIYKADKNGKHLVNLSKHPGYDAEATVCQKDGSIIFTSVRDGDLELYRMNADGSGVERLTHTPGYDGGAFFNQDCTQIVWRASRPQGEQLKDYQQLLKKGLVRPTKLELFVANADGSEPRQITYLNAASFAPYFHPSQKRVLFSSNYGDPEGREFDIWAINVDGTELERITYTPGFDGFPMFSPDGSQLAFASNRASADSTFETNLFVAEWREKGVRPAMAETSADRIRRDIAWLAHPTRQGRGLGTSGLEQSGNYVAKRFKQLGLKPAGDSGSFRQMFKVVTKTTVKPSTSLALNGHALVTVEFQPLSTSAQGEVKASVVFAGYGIVDKELARNDYAGLKVKNKIVLVRRFVPDTKAFGDIAVKRRLGDLDYKAWVARERGAKALLVVDMPEATSQPTTSKPAPHGQSGPPKEAAFPSLTRRGYGDTSIPVVFVKRAAIERWLPMLKGKQKVFAALNISLGQQETEAFNVAGWLVARSSARRPNPIVVGAHYDHLGLGGPGSLAPDSHEPHLGADDNASGVATMLEVARQLRSRQAELSRDILFVAFSAEESGLLGSTHFTRHPPKGLALDSVYAMLNLDMVGRMTKNTISVLGSQTADEWDSLIEAACQKARINCKAGSDGYGPSDQTPFYAAGVPVLHFFSGAHADYHKPSDTVERINAAGAAQIGKSVVGVIDDLMGRDKRLTLRQVPAQPVGGDLRSFNASLGSIPDYTGPPEGQKGVLFAGVRTGGAAEKAGLKRGDILVQLGPHPVGNVEDLMHALNALEPGQVVVAKALRDGQRLEFDVTLQEGH